MNQLNIQLELINKNCDDIDKAGVCGDHIRRIECRTMIAEFSTQADKAAIGIVEDLPKRFDRNGFRALDSIDDDCRVWHLHRQRADRINNIAGEAITPTQGSSVVEHGEPITQTAIDQMCLAARLLRPRFHLMP